MSWKERVFRYGIRHKRRIQTVLANLPPVSGKRCLDLGCGNGVFGWVLKQRGADVFGLDVSPEMARLATADTPAIVGDGCALPFQSGTFDIVFALEVVYFLDDERAAREIARVLKPGGVLVLTVLSSQPSLDVRRIYSLLGAHYVRGRREYHDDQMIAAAYPGFYIIQTDSFSIFFVEILQAVLYRLRQGRSVRPETIATRDPSIYSGIGFYRLIYPIFHLFFFLDGVLKRLGASGHNKLYVLKVG